MSRVQSVSLSICVSIHLNSAVILFARLQAKHPPQGIPLESHCAYAETKDVMGIHREAPPFIDQSTEQEILVTGIKVGHAHPVHGSESSSARRVTACCGMQTTPAC